MFNVNNNEKASRVDVHKNGDIVWVAGGRGHDWLSLTGIMLGVRPKKMRPQATNSGPNLKFYARIAMQNGWAPYGSGYRQPVITRTGPLCMLGGLVKATNGMQNPITTLPPNCRPNKRLVFNLNNHENTIRVDVLPSGQVRKVAGAWKHGWLSLDGIFFTVIAGRTTMLQNGWQNVPLYGQVTYTAFNKICELEGLVAKVQFKEMYQLKPLGLKVYKGRAIIAQSNTNQKIKHTAVSKFTETTFIETTFKPKQHSNPNNIQTQTC